MKLLLQLEWNPDPITQPTNSYMTWPRVLLSLTAHIHSIPSFPAFLPHWPSFQDTMEGTQQASGQMTSHLVCARRPGPKTSRSLTHVHLCMLGLATFCPHLRTLSPIPSLCLHSETNLFTDTWLQLKSNLLREFFPKTPLLQTKTLIVFSLLFSKNPFFFFITITVIHHLIFR